MDKKLYYTDKYYAKIMNRDFDVYFESLDDEFVEAWTSVDGKFYVHKDSYPIFEPRGGDVITFYEHGDMAGELMVKRVKDGFYIQAHSSDSVIILRDGKHFLMAETEEDATTIN